MSKRWEMLKAFVELRQARIRELGLMGIVAHELNMVALEMAELEDRCDKCGFTLPKNDPRGCSCERDE